jgi:hypothetical protein
MAIGEIKAPIEAVLAVKNLGQARIARARDLDLIGHQLQQATLQRRLAVQLILDLAGLPRDLLQLAVRALHLGQCPAEQISLI